MMPEFGDLFGLKYPFKIRAFDFFHDKKSSAEIPHKSWVSVQVFLFSCPLAVQPNNPPNLHTTSTLIDTRCFMRCTYAHSAHRGKKAKHKLKRETRGQTPSMSKTHSTNSVYKMKTVLNLTCVRLTLHCGPTEAASPFRYESNFHINLMTAVQTRTKCL